MNLAENYPIEMRSLLKRMIELYGKADAKTIAEALPDSYVGKVFMPKGTVATVADLPDEGNEIGDMYHVTEDEGEYAWWPTTEYPDGHWEFMGSVSGSSDLFTVTVDTETTPYTADKTFSEVDAAITANKTVVYVGILNFVHFQAITVERSGANIRAYGIVRDANGPRLVTLSHSSSSISISSIGLEETPITTAVTGSTPTIALCENNHIYECGELSSLTVTAIDNPGEFSITFTSGSTATVLTVPNTMIMPDSFAVEASTRYEINVKDGYALVAGWAVSA